MYSGTTFRHKSGNIIGVHQRINRIAKRHLRHKIGNKPFFPSIKTILHFEGKNGPDGIKSKSPSIDEPWHFISPDADLSDPLIQTIEDHIHNLAAALKAGDEERAAFEAAWASHAIVDGLTPAHQYPLAEKIAELWGKPHHERSSKRDKIIIRGTGKRDMVAKNWKYWGASGVFNQHWLFEFGVASSMTISKFSDIGLTESDFKRVVKEGYGTLYLEAVREVNALQMYEAFAIEGWSVKLGNMSRGKLVPIICKLVVLSWYAAVMEASRER